MSSRHDVMTLIITLALIVGGVVLVVTHNLNDSLSNLFMGILPAIFGYWFGRGGSASATETYNQVGGGNAGTVPSNGSGQN